MRGEAELARAGAPIRAPWRAPKSAKRQGNPIVFTPVPAPRAVTPARPGPIHVNALAPSRAAPTQSPDLIRESMVAIGGRPGPGLIPQGYGYPAPPDIAAVSAFTKWHTNTETMLAALAAKSDAQERRIAALEAAAADRRANALDVAQALAGLFSFAIRR